MVVHKQSLDILFSDLRVALAADQPSEALRRIKLFEMMHTEANDQLQGIEMPERKRLVLRVETDELVICDEYYPDDNGRVHMIPAHRYATFDRSAMSLDFNKVAMDVIEIVYEGDEWPSELTETSHSAVVAHFIGQPSL